MVIRAVTVYYTCPYFLHISFQNNPATEHSKYERRRREQIPQTAPPLSHPWHIEKYGLNFFIASTIKEEGTEGDPVYTTVFLSRSPDLEDMKKYAENNTSALAKAYPCFDEVQHFDDDEDIEQNRVETLVYSHLDPPYCVTNDYGYNGAGVLYCDDVLEKLWEKIGDYFILAFSTRDVFVYPAKDYDMDEYLLEMADQIEEWKKEEKEKGTFLTDRIFFYNGLGLKEYKR